jgi:hypothetical protein
MSVLNISGLWLLLLLPLIVLLYLLKLRRDERKVSSTFLWQRMVRDLQANAPWQRIQHNLLLLLQLLFLIALIIAIIRPATRFSGIDNRTVVMIFDTSASMAASDIQPDRLGSAKQTAVDLIGALPGDARVTIIAAGSKPTTLVSMSTDRRLINRAINELQPEAGGSNMADALQIASAIAQRQVDTQVVLFSDGSASFPERITLPGDFRYINVGSKEENQAIELLSIQSDREDQSLSAFAQVANYSSQPVKRRIAFYADGALFNASDLEIPAGSEQSAIASGILSTTTLIEAYLLPSEVSADFLSLDDRAYAVVHPSEPVKAALIGNGNLFLETALSLIPALELDLLKPGEPVDPETNLVIFDGNLPSEESLPKANLLFIAPVESSAFFTVTGKIDLPIPTKVEPANPIIEHVDLSGISILDAARVIPPVWAEPLIEDGASPAGDRPPLLFAGETGGRRVAMLAFDLSRTDLPLQVAFPILISNLVSWLTPGNTGNIPSSVLPGTPVSLTGLAPANSSANQGITIRRPDGTKLLINSTISELVFAGTNQLGVYTVDSGNGKPVQFAVNLFLPGESNLKPNPLLPVVGLGSHGETTSAGLSYQEWWRLAALIALILLTLEWLFYHRATLAKWMLYAKTRWRRVDMGMR